MSENYLEKRREGRQTAHGGLRLMLAGEPGSLIDGSLVDISGHGFRAAHEHAGLVTGQEVEFEHTEGRGRARVIWTRILGSSVESGFLVLGRPAGGE